MLLDSDHNEQDDRNPGMEPVEQYFPEERLMSGLEFNRLIDDEMTIETGNSGSSKKGAGPVRSTRNCYRMG